MWNVPPNYPRMSSPGSIQRVISYRPQILTLPAKKVNAAVQYIRTKCLFTAQQMRDILRDSPEVMEEDLKHLELKFQVVFFSWSSI